MPDRAVDVSIGPTPSIVPDQGSATGAGSPAAAGGGPGAIRHAKSPAVIIGALRAFEGATIPSLGVLLAAISGVFGGPYGAAAAGLIGLVSLAMVVTFQLADVDRIQALRSRVRQHLRVLLALAGSFAAAGAVAYFMMGPSAVLRDWLMTWALLSAGVLVAARAILGHFVRVWSRKGLLDRFAVVVGGGPAAGDLAAALAGAGDIRLLGVFDDRSDDRSPPEIAGLPKLGNVDDLVAFARRTRLDAVIFTVPISAEQRILEMLRKLWVLPVDIRLWAHRSDLRFRPRAYSWIGDVPFLDILDRPLGDWDLVLKSIFDRVLGGLLLVGLAPVMLAVAIAVKLESRGPVFFRQKRYGFNNEPIEVWKFRSMYVDRLDPAAKKSVTRDDPRVTRVGRFIRRTSLDELPQLFNVVIFGNLSLVGPRPHAVQQRHGDRLFEEVVDGYFARHKVKPGMTGWAQINGWRGEIDAPEKIQRRVEHDIYYIENWSILFDLYIVAKTPFTLVKAENAY